MSIDLKPLTSTNPYRLAAMGLYTEVLNCPKYVDDSKCASDLKPGYQPGPEMSFIGSRYGHSGNPRILFTRVAPNWDKRAESFGTKESVDAMLQAERPTSLDTVFDCLRDYWIDVETQILFQGCNCWNTVAGKGNFPRTVDRIQEFQRRSPFNSTHSV